MIILLSLLISSSNTDEDYYTQQQQDIVVPMDSILPGNDSLILHQRGWSDYANYYYYTMNYQMETNMVAESRNHRNAFDIYNFTTDYDYWGQVYDSLYTFNKYSLKKVEDSLRYIGKINNMKRQEFAELVVTFVQDIPYNYILWDEKCGDISDGKPCVDGEKYGILSPNEFLATLAGDCDTRAVTIYLMLKNFGYDPIIITSDKYAHAALALDLPASGDAFMHNHKKYYFWETTNVGWELGMIPAGYQDWYYWEVALD